MKFDSTIQNDQLLKEFGQRLSRYRLKQKLTQAVLAKQAGVSKRTVERMESGQSIQMSNFMQVMRVLNLLESFDKAIPEKPVQSPVLPKTLTVKQPSVKARKTSTAKTSKSRSWGFGV